MVRHPLQAGVGEHQPIAAPQPIQRAADVVLDKAKIRVLLLGRFNHGGGRIHTGKLGVGKKVFHHLGAVARAAADVQGPGRGNFNARSQVKGGLGAFLFEC